MSFNINSLISKILDKFDNSSSLKTFVGGGDKTQKSEPKSWFADWYGKFTSNNAPAARSNISQNVFLPQATTLDFTDADVKKQWQAEGGRLYAAAPENRMPTAAAPTNLTSIIAPQQISGGVETFEVSASRNPPDPAELSDLVLKQIGYTAGMIKAYEQKYGEDPRRDVAHNLKNCIDTKGCVKNPKPLPGAPGAPTGRYTIKVEVSNLVTMRLKIALRDLSAPGKAAIAGKTPLEIAEMIKAAKEREATGTSNQPQPSQSLNGQTVTAAGTTLAPALPFPKAGSLPQIDGKTLGAVATGLGELALPASAVLIEAVGPLLLTNEFLKLEQKGAALEYVQRARTQALEQPFPPLSMTIDDAEPLPQPQSEAKPKERPFAEPNAKPQVTDLPTAPTDLVPVPKTNPETTTSQPDAPTVDTDAQPYTPDAPRNNQPQTPTPKSGPPQTPKDIVPPIIGAVTANAGKAAADAMNANVKVVRTQPSLPPDPNRSAEGTPEKTIPNSVIPDEIRQNEDIELQNKSADILAKAGYKVKHRHNIPISAEEVKNNPLLKIGKQPDFDVEGKIFDHLAAREGTSVRNLVTRSIKRDKIEKGQATNFIVNLDKSNLTFDQLKEQLEKYPVDGLDELIIVKDGKVTPFYPFEK